MLGKDEGSRQQEPLWDAENRNVLVAPKVTLAINQGINSAQTSPSHRLLHCIHVSLSFPQLPFSVPSIFSFSQQYLSDAITSEAEKSFLSVRDLTHELLKMFAVRESSYLRTLHDNGANSKNCTHGSQGLSFTTDIHDSATFFMTAHWKFGKQIYVDL